MKSTGAQLILPSAPFAPCPSGLRPELTALKSYTGNICLLKSMAKP